MKNLYHRLLLLIAGATHQELARHVRYLKTEKQILRSKRPCECRSRLRNETGW